MKVSSGSRRVHIGHHGHTYQLMRQVDGLWYPNGHVTQRGVDDYRVNDMLRRIEDNNDPQLVVSVSPQVTG